MRIKKKKNNKRRKRPVQHARLETSLTFLPKRPNPLPTMLKKKKKRNSLSLKRKMNRLSLKRKKINPSSKRKKNKPSSKRKKNNLSSKRKRKRACWMISSLPQVKKFPKMRRLSETKKN
jgi:hypothetical protein